MEEAKSRKWVNVREICRQRVLARTQRVREWSEGGLQEEEGGEGGEKGRREVDVMMNHAEHMDPSHARAQRECDCPLLNLGFPDLGGHSQPRRIL